MECVARVVNVHAVCASKQLCSLNTKTGADGSGDADRKLYFNIVDDPAQCNCGPRSEITENQQRTARERAVTAYLSEMRKLLYEVISSC